MQDFNDQPEQVSDFAALQNAIERNPLVVSPEISVAQAVELMEQQSGYVLVESGQKLLGILTERDVVQLTARGMYLSETPVANVMTGSLITLEIAELQSPFAALTLFQRYRIRHLPIVSQQGSLIGVLTPQALRQTLQSTDLLQLRRVADAMTVRVITASPTTRVIALAQLMANHLVSCVVIVEDQAAGAETDHAPLGIVTERDIVKFQSQQLDLYTLTAEEVMSAPLSCVSPEDTLWESHQAMDRLRVRRLVVARNGRLAGIITQTSILSALNPVELYDTIQVLQTELDRLRDKQLVSLEARSSILAEQMQETESRFQAVFNNVFHFIGLMSPDGTVLDVNQTALAVGDISLDEIVGQPSWETYWWTISPETQTQHRQAIAKAAQGEVIRYEVDLLGVGREILSIDFSLRPLMDAQGNVTLLIGEGRDITNRKRTEQALAFQIEFDRLVASIANRFISLPSEEVGAGIQRSLQEIGEFIGIDTCYVFQFADAQSTLKVTYKWIAPGFTIQIKPGQTVPRAALPWFCEKLCSGEVLDIANIDELPESAAVDQQTFKKFDVKSILSIPLVYQEEVLGWVGFASYTQEQQWSEDSIRLLSIFGTTLTQILQRQQSEQALRQSEQRFQAIFNNTFQFTGLMKPDGTLIEANQTALDFGGLRQEDVIGLPFWETHWWTISPETQTQLREATDRAAQGEFIRYEVDVLGGGGQVVTIDFSLRPLKDEQGNIILLIPEGRDISDRKRAEEALKFQIEFDRLVADIANRFISLPLEELDAGIQRSLQDIGEFTGVETSYVFQFSEDQSALSMIHEWVASGFPPQIEHVQDIPTAAFPWGCEKLIRGETLYLPDLDKLPAEAAVDRQSFQRFNLKAILSIPLVYQKKVQGWVGFASFTHEQQWSEDSIRLLSIFGATLTHALQRQQSEQALKQSEQRFRGIFNNTYQCIALMQPDGTLLEVNDAALEFGGLQLEDVLGLPIWETYWWSLSTETQQRLRQATEQAAKGEFSRFEAEVVGAGETRIMIDASLRPVRDDQGNVTLVIFEGPDITELKQIQRDLTFQIEFDRLIAGLSNRFINLPTPEIPAAIDRSLRELGEFAQVETSYLFKYSEDIDRAWMTHEWLAPGITPLKDQAQDLPSSAFPWSSQLVANGETVYIPDIDLLSTEAEIDQQNWQRLGFRSILIIPLGIAGKIFGSVGFGTFQKTMDWSQHNIQMLQFFAEILSNAIQRQQDEWALRESSRQYEDLVTRIPVGVYTMRMLSHGQKQFDYVSPRWCELNQIPQADILANPDLFFELVHPEDRVSIMELFERIQTNPETFVWEGRMVIEDDVRWMHLESSPTVLESGEIVCNGLQYDITERIQARLKLQDSEERLRLALASAKQGFYDLNLQTDEMIVNDDFARMLDYDPETFQETSTGWVDRLHPEGAEAIIQTFEACVRGDIPNYSLEIRQRTGKGDWKWILCQGKVVEWDEAGHPIRMLGTQTDIDALKQAEQLKSELRVLEDILEATLAGYWDWDLPNNREYLSPTFKQMLGYEDHELANEPESWQRLIFEEDLSGVEAKLEQHIQSRGEVPFYNEVRYRHKNGSVIWVICAGRVIDWDEAGNPLRLVGCHVDITQRKQAEEQLRSLNQELQRSNKDLEQFAYITSHDLQEPLRAVTAYTNLLLGDYGDVLTDDNAQKYTGYILDGTQRMRELIRDLLTYSRVGSNELKWASVDCNNLLEEVQLNLQEAIAESQAQITIESLPVIEGDRTQLLQLFQNLISNAIKFNQGDPPTVRISAVHQSTLQPHQQPANVALRHQSHWLFSVQDQGIGIRQKYLERIFEIFRRLHTREQFPGTGMGLSICKRVVERHGGDIWVESQLGDGSTFYFTFLTHQASVNPDARGEAM